MTLPLNLHPPGDTLTLQPELAAHSFSGALLLMPCPAGTLETLSSAGLWNLTSAVWLMTAGALMVKLFIFATWRSGNTGCVITVSAGLDAMRPAPLSAANAQLVAFNRGRASACAMTQRTVTDLGTIRATVEHTQLTGFGTVYDTRQCRTQEAGHGCVYLRDCLGEAETCREQTLRKSRAWSCSVYPDTVVNDWTV